MANYSTVLPMLQMLISIMMKLPDSYFCGPGIQLNTESIIALEPDNSSRFDIVFENNWNR